MVTVSLLVAVTGKSRRVFSGHVGVLFGLQAPGNMAPVRPELLYAVVQGGLLSKLVSLIAIAVAALNRIAMEKPSDNGEEMPSDALLLRDNIPRRKTVDAYTEAIVTNNAPGRYKKIYPAHPDSLTVKPNLFPPILGARVNFARGNSAHHYMYDQQTAL